jgi:hypothetical protein
MLRYVPVRTMKLAGLTVLSSGLFIALSTVTPDGLMTGGGSAFVSDSTSVNPLGTRVTHGFQLQCNVNTVPNTLQVNWGPGDRFHLESITSLACLSSPPDAPPPMDCSAAPPDAPFFRHLGSGVGRYNGVPGYIVSWDLYDCGEPGTLDVAEIYVREPGPGNLVLELRPTVLMFGNHQAHQRAAEPEEEVLRNIR